MDENGQKTKQRIIDYMQLEPVHLGDYNPTQDDYYSEMAYQPSQRVDVKLPVHDDGLFVHYQRLATGILLGGEDILGKRDQLEVRETETVLQAFKRRGDKFLTPVSKYTLEREELRNQNYYLRPSRNPSLKYGYLAMAGYAISILGWWVLLGLSVLLFFIDKTQHGWKDFFSCLLMGGCFWLFFFLLWKISGYLSKTTDNGNWSYLNRRTGMVVLPRRQGPALEVPYKDFEPRILRSTGGQGEIYHTLMYVHKSGELSFGGGENFYADSYLRAVYLEQFMDITQPLPDIPPLEQYRDRDPTTVAYDKLTNRNPRYWRDKTEEEIAQIAKECLHKNLTILGEPAYRV